MRCDSPCRSGTTESNDSARFVHDCKPTPLDISRSPCLPTPDGGFIDHYPLKPKARCMTRCQPVSFVFKGVLESELLMAVGMGSFAPPRVHLCEMEAGTQMAVTAGALSYIINQFLPRPASDMRIIYLHCSLTFPCVSSHTHTLALQFHNSSARTNLLANSRVMMLIIRSSPTIPSAALEGRRGLGMRSYIPRIRFRQMESR